MFCKIILPSSEIHKLPAVPKSYEDLHQTALRKFKGKIPDKFYFKYKDCDDELITLSSDEDFETAIVTSESDKVKTLRIFLIPEGAPHNQNPNSYLPNLLPPVQEPFSSESHHDRGWRGKQGGRDSGAQGYGKRGGDGFDGNDEYDADKNLAPMNRQKKSQSHPEGEEEIFYDKRDGYEGGNRYGGRDVMGFPFNQEQLGVISEMLEKKLKEKVEQRVHIAVNDIMGKLNDDYRSKPVKKNPYTHNPLMSKSVVPGFSARPVVRNEKVAQQDLNEHTCVSCRKKIDDVKYSCLDCANFDCCEACEEKIDHPHSLLKTRLNKKPRAPIDLSEANASQSLPLGHHEANFGKYGSLMMSNKSQSNGILKAEEAGAHGGNRMGSNTMGPIGPGGPSGGHLMRFSNSMAMININDKNMSESHNPYAAKNPSFWGKNIGSINMSQSTFSSKNMATPTPGEREVKRYKAAIVKPPIYDLINVKPGHKYRVEFTIKNNGSEPWPENIKLVCINGVHKSTEEPLPALAPMDKFEVKLDLKAPPEPNRYLSQWRLQYTEDGTPKPFGSNLFIEINVADEQKPKAPPVDKDKEKKKIEVIEENEKEMESEEKEKENDKEKENEKEKEKEKEKDKDWEVVKEPEIVLEKKKEKAGSPNSGMKERVKPGVEDPVPQATEEKISETSLEAKPKLVVEDKSVELEDIDDFTPEEKRLMKEKDCKASVMRHALALHVIYPDIELEKQIDFVGECPIHLDINDIVMIYSSRVDQGFSMNY